MDSHGSNMCSYGDWCCHLVWSTLHLTTRSYLENFHHHTLSQETSPKIQVSNQYLHHAEHGINKEYMVLNFLCSKLWMLWWLISSSWDRRRTDFCGLLIRLADNCSPFSLDVDVIDLPGLGASFTEPIFSNLLMSDLMVLPCTAWILNSSLSQWLASVAFDPHW